MGSTGMTDSPGRPSLGAGNAQQPQETFRIVEVTEDTYRRRGQLLDEHGRGKHTLGLGTLRQLEDIDDLQAISAGDMFVQGGGETLADARGLGFVIRDEEQEDEGFGWSRHAAEPPVPPARPAQFP